MTLKEGLFLSDSLFKRPPYEVNLLKHEFSLDKVYLAAYPGRTTEDLIGKNGFVHQFMKTGTITHVFLCCGANDFNRSEGASSIWKGQHVVNIVQGNLHSFLQKYPSVVVTFFPIPFRQVASRKNERYPLNSDPDWIDSTNAGIQFFQEHFQVCNCHQSRCHWVMSPGLAAWIPLLELDGLHPN